MPRWTVYIRPGCALCQALMEDLALALGPQAAAEVEVIDISDDDDLERLYGAKVPVLAADGVEVCAYYLDRDAVARKLMQDS
jgi:hypothetical protein